VPTDAGDPSGPPPPPRDEMHAAPPFATWPKIYAVVLATLAAQVALYAILTAIYR
jgi:hypothetical protein